MLKLSDERRRVCQCRTVSCKEKLLSVVTKEKTTKILDGYKVVVNEHDYVITEKAEMIQSI